MNNNPPHNREKIIQKTKNNRHLFLIIPKHRNFVIKNQSSKEEMTMLKNGLTYTCTKKVEEHHLAIHMGSGDLHVLATPAMIALMEEAAMRAVAPYIPQESTTVGGQISSTHLKPTAHGRTISATATLTAVEGRKLRFTIIAKDEEGIIGEGEHLRFVVDRERFMTQLKNND